MLDIFIIENAALKTKGDGNSGSEGSFDTEFRANDDDDKNDFERLRSDFFQKDQKEEENIKVSENNLKI